jgi:hypothetical protein
MKKIRVLKWKAIDKDGAEVEETTITVLTAILNSKDPREMPTGFKQALMFSRIIKAFENKEELVLDDEDYDFIKAAIEKDTPALWGANPNIMNALGEFNAQDKI